MFYKTICLNGQLKKYREQNNRNIQLTRACRSKILKTVFIVL